jgi:hypothetical protein
MINLLHGREMVQNVLIYRYIVTTMRPKIMLFWVSLPHLLATIPLSPTDC